MLYMLPEEIFQFFKTYINPVRISSESLTGGGVIAIVDGNPALWGKERYGYVVSSPDMLVDLEYEKIVICNFGSADEIKDRLTNELSIPVDKINLSEQEIIRFLRERFVTDFADVVYREGISGSIAEGGVFKGDFAAHINKCFPDRKLWLFDTFGGFDEKDVDADIKLGFSTGTEGLFLNYPYVNEIVRKMANPQNLIVKKGVFPDSTKQDKELESEEFVFVNLDFDLYEPTIAGLKYFYPKMVHGGIILIHDFFTEFFAGAQQAVREFCSEYEIRYTPIGDGFSVAITKQ